MLVAIILAVAAAAPSRAETVYVKYRGPIDLGPLQCEWVTRSSLVQRLCYDTRHAYVVVSLNGTYYHYCNVPASVVSQWRGSESVGRFFSGNIKGRYDCRMGGVPKY